MREYLISYLAEKNDECVDLEIEVEATNILEAIYKFKEKVKVHKRIIKIEEL